MLYYFCVCARFFVCVFDRRSAIGKILMADGGKTVDMSRAIPAFLSGLPIRSDYAEATAAYGAMLALFANAPQLIVPHTPAVIEILLVAVHDTQVWWRGRQLYACCCSIELKNMAGSNSGMSVFGLFPLASIFSLCDTCPSHLTLVPF